MAKLLEYSTRETVLTFSTYRGEGTGSYEGFNITHYCGDTALHVEQCREELCRELGIDDNHLILPRQTHGDKVIAIDSTFMQLSKAQQTDALMGVDAIITDLEQTCIGVSTADCIPVLLHDTKHDVIAAIHAGWRGTVAMIVCKVIDKMKSLYGSCAGDIDAIIGPGISIDAFEVGDEVYEAFKEAGFAMQQIARRYPAAAGGEKWHIDLWEANSLLLQQCGVARENIHIAGVCTYKNHCDFFSARRLGIKSGRIFSGILLKPVTVG